MKSLLEQYKEILYDDEFYKTLGNYLKVPSLKRLNNIGYFCGMDYASKDIYDFPEYISRYDHSLSVALITWKLTKDKKSTIAALFHDISTPCFSHVIDYMNKDYKNQESTEMFTYDILKNDKELLECLKQDNLNIEDISNFKKYSIVDNDRPKLCADRLDGIILTGLYWTKDLYKDDIKNIIDNVVVYKNEFDELEIGFKNIQIAEFVVRVNKNIDVYCHSKEDNYMMELLADITRCAINKNIINYKELFILDEKTLFKILIKCDDVEIKEKIVKFQSIKLSDIPDINLPDVKIRTLKPLVYYKRI